MAKKKGTNKKPEAEAAKVEIAKVEIAKAEAAKAEAEAAKAEAEAIKAQAEAIKAEAQADLAKSLGKVIERLLIALGIWYLLDDKFSPDMMEKMITSIAIAISTLIGYYFKSRE